MSIDEQSESDMIVVNAQGEIATGTRVKKTFSVTSDAFGRPADNDQYLLCPPTFEFGFFAVDGSSAQADLRIYYTNCTDAITGKTGQSCSFLYNGNVTRQ